MYVSIYLYLYIFNLEDRKIDNTDISVAYVSSGFCNWYTSSVIHKISFSSISVCSIST